MDVVVTSSISAAETQHLQFDSLHVNAEPTAQRRQMRYTSPDISSSRSPRRMPETNTAGVRASPNSDEGYSAMSHTSPTSVPFPMASLAREEEPADSDILLEVNGQNHDRMETDMETDDSESDHQPHHGAENSGHRLAEATQDIDGEMDMTPDSPSAAESHHPLDPGIDTAGKKAVGGNWYADNGGLGTAAETADRSSPLPSTQIATSLHIPAVQNDADLHDAGAAHADGSATPRNNGISISDSVAFLPSSLDAPVESVVPPAFSEGDRPERADSLATRTESEHPPAPAVPLATSWDSGTNWEREQEAVPSRTHWEGEQETAPPRTNWEGEHEEDSQDDDSTDEEDFPFWANLKEDTSVPDQEELRAIEESGHEISALNCE